LHLDLQKKAGPLAGRISFCAPVSLFFFFLMLPHRRICNRIINRSLERRKTLYRSLRLCLFLTLSEQ